MITGLAHTGVCVPDCEAAVAFYRDVLGLRVLSPPYVMAGNAIRDDMGELVSDPTMKAAIVGFNDDSDRVLEVIEYLRVDGSDLQHQPPRAALTASSAVVQSPFAASKPARMTCKSPARSWPSAPCKPWSIAASASGRRRAWQA